MLVSPSADVDDTARYCDALREAGCVVQESGKDEEVEMSGTDHVVSNRLHIGKTCAFLCSEHAGFIIGQNILLDGGNVNASL